MNTSTLLTDNNKVYQCRLTMQPNADYKLAIMCKKLSGKLATIKFPSCVTKHVDPRCTTMISKSGKMVITGAESQEAAALTANKIVRRLRQSAWWYDVDVLNLHIVNIVCSMSVGAPLNLDLLCEDIESSDDLVSFEPDAFIGLSWKTGEQVTKEKKKPINHKKRKAIMMDQEFEDEIDDINTPDHPNPSITFVVFDTGNVVATGITRPSYVAVAQQRLEKLHKYIIGSEYRPFTGIPRKRKVTKDGKKLRNETKSFLKTLHPYHTDEQLDELVEQHLLLQLPNTALKISSSIGDTTTSDT